MQIVVKKADALKALIDLWKHSNIGLKEHSTDNPTFLVSYRREKGVKKRLGKGAIGGISG